MTDEATLTRNTPRYTVKLGTSNWSVATYGIVEHLRIHRVARTLVAILGIGIGLFSIASLMGLKMDDFESYAIPLLLFVVPWLLWVATVSGPAFQLVFPAEQAKQETQQAEKKFEASNTPEDALNLGLKRLNEYYVINQNQARSSFRWAIFSMFVGFGTIIAGIWFFYLYSAAPDKFMAALTTAAGCVVDLISGLFLYLHSRTQERSLVYFEQLAGLQRVILAIRLVSEHRDPQKQTEARNLVIRELLDASKDQKG